MPKITFLNYIRATFTPECIKTVRYVQSWQLNKMRSLTFDKGLAQHRPHYRPNRTSHMTNYSGYLMLSQSWKGGV